MTFDKLEVQKLVIYAPSKLDHCLFNISFDSFSIVFLMLEISGYNIVLCGSTFPD